MLADDRTRIYRSARPARLCITNDQTLARPRALQSGKSNTTMSTSRSSSENGQEADPERLVRGALRFAGCFWPFFDASLK